MNIVGAVNLAGFVDFGVCGERLFYKTAHLLFVVGVPFDSFYDQAMSRTPRLLGQSCRSVNAILVVVGWSSLLPLLRSFFSVYSTNIAHCAAGTRAAEIPRAPAIFAGGYRPGYD